MDETKFRFMMNIINALYMRHHGERPTPCDLTNTILNNPHLLLQFPPAVVIKNSEIQGKGVFAIRDINKGDVITLYPCHGYSPTGNPEKFKTILNPKIVHAELELIKSGSHSTHGNGIKIYGSPSIKCPNSMGHLINDCAEEKTVENLKNLQNSDSNIKMANAAIEYYLNAETYRNCSIIHHENYCYIKANKDITRGTELRTCYEPSYWLSDDKMHPMVFTIKTGLWIREKGGNKKKKIKLLESIFSFANRDADYAVAVQKEMWEKQRKLEL